VIALGEIEAATITRAALRLMNVSTSQAVERALARLLDFAKDGTGPAPADELQRVVYELFVPPSEREDIDPMTTRLRLLEGPGGDSAEGQLLVVVLAARGRLRLVQGMIEVGELAALAGCSTRHIRHLIDHGGLRRAGRAKRSPIAAGAAVAFLRDRGVPLPG